MSELRAKFAEELEYVEAIFSVPLHKRDVGQFTLEPETFCAEKLCQADSAIVKEAAEHLLYEGSPAMAIHVHLYKIRVRHIIGCAAEVIEIIKQKLIEAFTHSGYNVVFVEG